MPSATLSPQEFVAKWRKIALSERSSYQQHFLDLCRLVGHPFPADLDPSGAWFTFEAGAAKQQGGQGWADVWKKGFFGLEYKGKHANLDRAYQQLLQYRESLQNPPLLVVCDTEQIVIHTNFTNTVKQITTITLDDLLTPGGQQRLRDMFFNPDAFRAAQTTQEVTEQAAREFARLAELLRKWGEQPHRAAHFLIRLLFCLFAEDVGLLPNNLFTRLITATRTRPALFAAQLRELFAAMATGGIFALETIPHVNGKLFDNADVLELDSDMLDTLHRVSALDWSSIEPSILGTLFERSLDPSKRSQLGAHYTSRNDILLIVEPVLMAPLRQRWDAVQAECQALAANDRRPTTDDGKSSARSSRQASGIKHQTSSGNHPSSIVNRQKTLLTSFAAELGRARVLDPACGSGNFLYVALKQLLDLEKEVIAFAGDIGVGGFFPGVGPEQLRGIEINEYAHELAQVTVWIGYIQWLRDNGFGQPSEPILKPLDTIVQMDALMAFDEQGKPYAPAWPEADVVVGNPPFLGDKKMRAELGNTYVEALRKLYEGRVPGGADLVTYFFERARALIEAGNVQRAGLLATQSIRVGANRKVLERIKVSGDIFMAWSDRSWILNGAQVRVSMIGFDNGQEQTKRLDGLETTTINSNLTSTIDLTKAVHLIENQEIAFVGTQKGGNFDISSDIAEKMLKASLNPNGCPNSDVVRPWINGSDITAHAKGKWIIDFDPALSEEDALLYEAPFEYLKIHVKPKREENIVPWAREHWWIHERPRPAMRAAWQGLTRYIATPRVAKHRVFVFVPMGTIPDSRVAVITRDDDYFFGVLHSRVHEVWSLATSPRHGVGNDPTYNAQSCFETFPFPWPPGTEPTDDPRVAAIAEAARRLVELRGNWLNPTQGDDRRQTTDDSPHAQTPSSIVHRPSSVKDRTLTNLYNQRPAWLDMAHQRLDHAVLDAYGWPRHLSGCWR